MIGDPRDAVCRLSRQCEKYGQVAERESTPKSLTPAEIRTTLTRATRNPLSPAWRTKPSWYLVVTEDKMIPPDAQRFMSRRAGSTVVEVKGSHAIYISQPGVVAALIEQAAEGVSGSARVGSSGA